MVHSNLLIHPDVRDSMYRYGKTHYPNECSGLVLGYHKNGWSVGTDFLTLHELCNTPQYVVPDVEDIATKYRRFCVLGFYHTHIDCPCLPSNGDIGFVNRLQGILGTRVYLLIMKMPEGKLGCFLDNEPVSYGVLK